MRSIEFLKIGEILSKQHRVIIKEGDGWAANIQKRFIFYKKDDIYNLAEDHVLGLLLHEIAHIHYTTDTIPPKKHKELFHNIMNALEDISIEHLISQDYPNAGEILESTETELLDTLVRMLPKLNMGVHRKIMLWATIRFRGRGYNFGLEDYEKIGDEVADIMNKRQNEIYDRKQTKDLIPLAETILELLIRKAGEPSEEERAIMLAEAQGHINAEEKTQTGTATNAAIKRLGGKGFMGEGTHIHQAVEFVDSIYDQANEIGKKLRSVLKRNNAMEFGGRFRTGKLMTKRLVKTRTIKDRRPFGRRVIKSNQSYAFAIAADVSGSMFNTKYQKPDGSKDPEPVDYALSSMMMVGEALRKAGIPKAFVVFGGKAKVAQTMTRLAVTWSQIADQKTLDAADNSHTRINLAVDACTFELNKVKAERKIMVILTDGSSDIGALRDAYKRAKQAGIECIGITIGAYHTHGILNQVFQDHENYTIEDSNQTGKIGGAFIDLLKKTITKSG